MPYTRAVAHGEGWRWRIPLQTRVGNGCVYSSQYLSDDDARQRFIGMLDAEPLFEPRLIRYQTGTRRLSWNKNVVALGLSSGFIEPLESTSIHLFQIGVTRLAQLFPFDGVDPVLIDRFNALSRHELDRVRDFVILHYKATERDDTAFWRDRQAMPVPDTLAARIALFRETAHAYQESGDLFRVDSWVQCLTGQRVMPKTWHRMAAMMSDAQLGQALGAIKGNIARAVAALPTQEQFIQGYLATPQGQRQPAM
jgi:tryptophan halogenase